MGDAEILGNLMDAKKGFNSSPPAINFPLYQKQKKTETRLIKGNEYCWAIKDKVEHFRRLSPSS